MPEKQGRERRSSRDPANVVGPARVQAPQGVTGRDENDETEPGHEELEGEQVVRRS